MAKYVKLALEGTLKSQEEKVSQPPILNKQQTLDFMKLEHAKNLKIVRDPPKELTDPEEKILDSHVKLAKRIDELFEQT